VTALRKVTKTYGIAPVYSSSIAIKPKQHF